MDLITLPKEIIMVFMTRISKRIPVNVVIDERSNTIRTHIEDPFELQFAAQYWQQFQRVPCIRCHREKHRP